MTPDELRERTKTSFSMKEYREIEFVYNYHPRIDDVNGKEQIAYLYENFGMRLIRDMTPAAEKAKGLEEAIVAAKNEVFRLQEEYRKLKNGEEMEEQIGE